MNKKGFAISVILYSMIFLLISIFYMLLGILRTRYSVNSKLRDSIVDKLNDVGELGDKVSKLCQDSEVTYVEKYNAESNGIAIDTLDGSGDNDVCYYTGKSGKENSNIIFGNYCWQIVRTTTTGGIKLLYNGEKTWNNKCPNDLTKRPLTYGPIASSEYYPLEGGEGTDTIGDDGEVIYADSFETFEENGYRKFKLVDAKHITLNGSNYNSVVGKYICGSYFPIANTEICQYLFYVGEHFYENNFAVEQYEVSRNSTYEQIGKSSFNASLYPYGPNFVGYMYSDNYLGMDADIYRDSFHLILSYYTSSSFYYGDTAVWNSSSRKYELKVDDGNGNYVTPTSTTLWTSIRGHVKGKYTCRSNRQTSCASVYYVIDNSNAYDMDCIELSNGESIEDKVVTWTYGTGIEENGGTYTLTGVHSETFALENWNSVYPNFKNVYLCEDYTSSTCNEVIYITTIENGRIEFYSSRNKFIFGNSVSYINGEYIINTDANSSKYHYVWNFGTDFHSLDNSHYTCFLGESDNCGEGILYVYHFSDDGIYAIGLLNGDKIEDVLGRILNLNNANPNGVNKYNSSIKGIVDSWYRQNLSHLEGYIDENAVFCNDRSIKDLGGWTSTGDSTKNLLFKYSGPSVSKSNAKLGCSNLTDRFSKNNAGVAELRYPIGLLTESESVLMQTSSYTINGNYWFMTPEHIGGYAFNRYSVNKGDRPDGSDSKPTNNHMGIRPVVVLRGDLKTTGTGTYDDPYIILESSELNLDG